MFCIFPTISPPRAFTFEATEKGLRHFSFSDVFRTFQNLGACLSFRKLPKIFKLQSLIRRNACDTPYKDTHYVIIHVFGRY